MEGQEAGDEPTSRAGLSLRLRKGSRPQTGGPGGGEPPGLIGLHRVHGCWCAGGCVHRCLSAHVSRVCCGCWGGVSLGDCEVEGAVWGQKDGRDQGESRGGLWGDVGARTPPPRHRTCPWSPVPPLQPGVRGLAVRRVLGQRLTPLGRWACDAHLQLAGVLLVLWAVGKVRAGQAPWGDTPTQRGQPQELGLRASLGVLRTTELPGAAGALGQGGGSGQQLSEGRLLPQAPPGGGAAQAPGHMVSHSGAVGLGACQIVHSHADMHTRVCACA